MDNQILIVFNCKSSVIVSEEINLFQNYRFYLKRMKCVQPVRRLPIFSNHFIILLAVSYLQAQIMKLNERIELFQVMEKVTILYF